MVIVADFFTTSLCTKANNGLFTSLSCAFILNYQSYRTSTFLRTNFDIVNPTSTLTCKCLVDQEKQVTDKIQQKTWMIPNIIVILFELSGKHAQKDVVKMLTITKTQETFIIKNRHTKLCNRTYSSLDLLKIKRTHFIHVRNLVH